MTHPVQYLVELIDWQKGKDAAGFLCGYRETETNALSAQQLVEYGKGLACRVVVRAPSRNRQRNY